MKVARRADGSLPTWSTPTAAGRHETPCPSQGAGRGAGEFKRLSMLSKRPLRAAAAISIFFILYSVQAVNAVKITANPTTAPNVIPMRSSNVR